MSHIISTTKFAFFEKKAEDQTDDGEVDNMAVDFVRNVQKGGKKEGEDDRPRVERRMTVHNLSKHHKKNKFQEREEVNLEREFRKRFQSMGQFGFYPFVFSSQFAIENKDNFFHPGLLCYKS